jgi:hypothetical protein
MFHPRDDLRDKLALALVMTKLGIGRTGAEHPVQDRVAEMGENARARPLEEGDEHRFVDLIFMLRRAADAVDAND